MALTKEQKQARVEALHGELAEAGTVILASFSGLTVEQDYELRKQLRAAGARYRVLKNTLAERAAEGTVASPVLKELKGINSIAYTGGDPVAMAKALQKYAKENPSFQLTRGVVDGKAISAAEIGELASLPSKEELYSKLLYLLQAPAQRLVTVLNATGRNTAVVLDQGVQAKKFREE